MTPTPSPKAKIKIVEKHCEHCRGKGIYTLQGRNSFTIRQCVKCRGKGVRNCRVPAEVAP